MIDKELLQDLENIRIDISLSHIKEFAIATAVVFKD